MSRLEGKRKFLIAVLAVVLVTVVLFVHAPAVPPDELAGVLNVYLLTVLGLAGVFKAANVGEHWTRARRS